MRFFTVPTICRQRDVPETIRSLSSISLDYVDLFTARTRGAAGKSPEQWARAGVEDAAGSGGQFVWRVLLGLPLGPRRSPDHVGGWKIAERGAGWIRLEEASWFLTVQ